MSKETDLDELSLLRHGYERFFSSPGGLADCENAIITVRRQQQITTHFGPLTTKNKIKVSLSQEQILNQSNRFRSNIKRSQSTNIHKTLVSPSGAFGSNRGNPIRPSLIPVKIKEQPKLRALTLTPHNDSNDKDNPKYRPVRKLSAPFERRNYISPQESALTSLPLTMTQSSGPSLHPGNGQLDKFKCGICLNILSDSRVLDCLHTFCLECLYSIESGNQLKTTVNRLNPTLPLNSFECSKLDMSSSNCSDESKESDRKISKTSVASSSKPIRKTFSMTSKKRPEEPKQKSMTVHSKRPLSSITEKSKVSLKCPICNHRTEIPIGGVSRVPKNFLLDRQLQDEIQKLQTQYSNNEYCSQCYDEVEAVSYCLNCEANLCGICQEAHVRQRWTSKHNVINLPDFKYKLADIRKEKEQGPASNAIVKCFIHPTQDLKLFCINCNQVACHNCTILLHKGHSFESIDNAKQHIIESFHESVEQNQRYYEYINDSISKTTVSISKINDKADIVQMEIEIFLRDYFEALEAHKESLKRQIVKAKEMKSISVTEHQEYLQKRALDTKIANQFAENLLQNGSDIEILTFIGVLQNRFEFCQKSRIPVEPNISDSLEFLRDARAPTTQYQHNIPIFGVLSSQEME